MLQLDHITVRLNRRLILRELSLEIGEGLTMLLGKNGAGKTTLIRTLLGFCKPEEGQVLYEGVPLIRYSLKQRGTQVAYVPQIYQGGMHYSVRDFVTMGANPHMGMLQIPDEKTYEQAERVLAGLNLGHLGHRLLGELSGGEQKLAYIARAVMQKAKWMVLDEPTAHLDFGKQHQFLSRLKAVGKEQCTGVLMSIHDPAMAYQYADRILLMDKGELVRDLHTGEPDFELELEQGLQRLYGEELRMVQTDKERVLVWR